MLYYSIFFMLLLASFYSIITNKRGFVAGASISVLLASIAALRYGSGIDFFTYQTIWEVTSFDFALNYLEPGFLIVNNILKIIYKGDFLFFLFYSFTTFMFLFVGLKKLPINLIAPLFLYFCLFYFAFTINAMRQALSMAMFVYSLSYLIEGRSKQFFLWNLLAMSFHISSIVYVLFGFIWFLGVSKKLLLISFYFPFLALFLYMTGISYDIFAFSTTALGKPANYLDEWIETVSATQWTSRILLFFIVYFFTLNHHKEKFLATLGFFYVTGFSLYILFADVAMLSSRLNMAFRVSEIIIAGALIAIYHSLPSRLFIFFVFACPYTIQFIANMANPHNQYVLRSVF